MHPQAKRTRWMPARAATSCMVAAAPTAAASGRCGAGHGMVAGCLCLQHPAAQLPALIHASCVPSIPSCRPGPDHGATVGGTGAGQPRRRPGVPRQLVGAGHVHTHRRQRAVYRCGRKDCLFRINAILGKGCALLRPLRRREHAGSSAGPSTDMPFILAAPCSPTCRHPRYNR